MRRSVVSAFVITGLLLGWSRAALAEPRWIRVDTPNFIVIGSGGERHLANVGAQFEGFREALTRLVSQTAASSPVPTVVILFPDEASFAPYKPTYEGKPVNVGGLYASQSHINYILLGPGHADDDLRGLFHEFTHLVIRNTSPGVPLWLNEGLAEYYSSFQIGNDGRSVVIGAPIEAHLHVLAREPWLPLSTLIATDQSSPQYNENSRRGIFYAESWLLVHMLLQATPDRSRALAAYVDAAQNGVPADAAWLQAFGRDDVMPALRQYAERPMLKSQRYTMSTPIEARAGSAVPFSDADRAIVLDEALVALGRRQYAQPRTRTASGGDWFNDYMIAAGLFAKGVPMGEANRLTALTALDRVLATRPDLLNALYMCAILDDVTGRDPPRAVEYLQKVHRAVPARDDYSLAFAQALARSGDFANAKAVAADVIEHPHLEGMKEQALGVMREIVAAERQSR